MTLGSRVASLAAAALVAGIVAACAAPQAEEEAGLKTLAETQAWVDEMLAMGRAAADIEDLAGAVDRGLRDPRLSAERRAHYREQLFGDLTDGHAAERIAEHISVLEL